MSLCLPHFALPRIDTATSVAIRRVKAFTGGSNYYRGHRQQHGGGNNGTEYIWAPILRLAIDILNIIEPLWRKSANFACKREST